MMNVSSDQEKAADNKQNSPRKYTCSARRTCGTREIPLEKLTGGCGHEAVEAESPPASRIPATPPAHKIIFSFSTKEKSLNNLG